MPTVLLLPDSALLVSGAAGGLCDPLAAARSAAVGVLQAIPRGRETLVIAPGRADRVLRGPYGDGLAAAGIDGSRLPGGTGVHSTPGGTQAHSTPGRTRASSISSGTGASSISSATSALSVPSGTRAPSAPGRPEPASAIRRGAAAVSDLGGPRDDVPVPPGSVPAVGAAAALALLRLAGHDPDRTATVYEVGPLVVPTAVQGDGCQPPTVLPALPRPVIPAPTHPLGVDRQPVPDLIVVVGSLSARHGPDAPLADDPAAIPADRALLDALATGPDALARSIAELGDAIGDRLAITGVRPWRVLLAVLAGAGPSTAIAAGAGPVLGTAGAAPVSGATASGSLPQVRADLLWSGTPGGAQHAVARWEVAG